MSKLTKAAKDQGCVRCEINDGTTVLAHYTGVRRGSFGGGLGIKSHDICGAHLCGACHEEMDRISRDKEARWDHSEQFLYYIALTTIRLMEKGVLK